MGVAALLAARKLASLEASLGFSERPGPEDAGFLQV